MENCTILFSAPNHRAGFGSFRTNKDSVIIIGLTGLYLSVAQKLAQTYTEILSSTTFDQLHEQLISDFKHAYFDRKAVLYTGSDEVVITGFGQAIIRPDGQVQTFTKGHFQFNILQNGLSQFITDLTTLKAGDYLLGDAEGAYIAPFILSNLQKTDKDSDLSIAIGHLFEPFALVRFNQSMLSAPTLTNRSSTKWYWSKKFRRALFGAGIGSGLLIMASLYLSYVAPESISLANGGLENKILKKSNEKKDELLIKNHVNSQKEASLTEFEDYLTRYQANKDSTILLVRAAEKISDIHDKTKQKDERLLLDIIINSTIQAKAEEANESLDRAGIYAREGKKQAALKELDKMEAIYKHLLPLSTFLTNSQNTELKKRLLQRKQLTAILETDM